MCVVVSETVAGKETCRMREKQCVLIHSNAHLMLFFFFRMEYSMALRMSAKMRKNISRVR